MKTRKKVEKQRRAWKGALDDTLRELRINESEYRYADDPNYIEQLIYQRAALLCRCRTLLQLLRQGSDPL